MHTVVYSHIKELTFQGKYPSTVSYLALVLVGGVWRTLLLCIRAEAEEKETACVESCGVSTLGPVSVISRPWGPYDPAVRCVTRPHMLCHQAPRVVSPGRTRPCWIHHQWETGFLSLHCVLSHHSQLPSCPLYFLEFTY